MKIGKLHVTYETENEHGQKEADLSVHYDNGKLKTRDEFGEEDWIADYANLRDALGACWRMFVGIPGYIFSIERSIA